MHEQSRSKREISEHEVRITKSRKDCSSIRQQASDFKGAYDNFMQGMKGTMADFEIIGITETAIMDVFKAKLAE